jgi:hypothetical protein
VRTFTGLGDAMTEAESSNPLDTLEPSEVEENLSSNHKVRTEYMFRMFPIVSNQ